MQSGAVDGLLTVCAFETAGIAKITTAAKVVHRACESFGFMRKIPPIFALSTDISRFFIRWQWAFRMVPIFNDRRGQPPMAWRIGSVFVSVNDGAAVAARSIQISVILCHI
jgi:hypothetical protein